MDKLIYVIFAVLALTFLLGSSGMISYLIIGVLICAVVLVALVWPWHVLGALLAIFAMFAVGFLAQAIFGSKTVYSRGLFVNSDIDRDDIDEHGPGASARGYASGDRK